MPKELTTTKLAKGEVLTAQTEDGSTHTFTSITSPVTAIAWGCGIIGARDVVRELRK